MKSARVWGTTQDGAIDIVSLTSNHLEGATFVMDNSFLKHETVCGALQVTADTDAVEQVHFFCSEIMRDGMTLVAIDRTNQNVVGVSINKILTKQGEEGEFYKKFQNVFTSPKARDVLDFIVHVDDHVDVFAGSNTECMMELTFMAVLPQVRRRGVAKLLTECALKMVKLLNEGENVKVGKDGEEIALEPIPQGVYGIFTSRFTQQMARRLEFIEIAEWGYDHVPYNGTTFASIIDAENASLTVAYKLV